MAMIPTFGRVWTGASAYPMAARAARYAGVRRVPAAKAGEPTAMSSPAGRTWVPAARVAVGVTLSGAAGSMLFAASSVSSTWRMASAPSGSGAPVMIRWAEPGVSGSSECEPAAISASIWSGTPGATSAARTANPSIAEFVNGGIAKRAATSSLRTKPRASASGIWVAGVGTARPTTSA